MRFVRFGDFGREKAGVLDSDDRIRDLSKLANDIDGSFLSSDLFWALGFEDILALPYADVGVRWGACVGSVGKLICIGLNYNDHAKETGMALPEEPVIFMKATSSLCGAYDPLEIPRHSSQTDWEVELAVIIGKHAKYVGVEEAMDYVAGYALMNDVSEREFQIKRGGQFVKGKSCDSFAPLGPWLLRRDAMGDVDNLKMQSRVNGEVKQNGTTANMIFKVAYVVSYLSQFMSLHAGDVISTGTPAGVGMGMRPQQFLRSGDVVEVEIEQLGHGRQEAVSA